MLHVVSGKDQTVKLLIQYQVGSTSLRLEDIVHTRLETNIFRQSHVMTEWHSSCIADMQSQTHDPLILLLMLRQALMFTLPSAYS